jgi:hypothetical protein
MSISNTLQVLCVLGPLAGSIPASAEIPANFRTGELVAWCIVPFDAKKRGPAARTEMLAEIGLKRCAYDWRAEHVPTFEEEILHYKKHGVEYFAFWGEHEAAFSLFKKHGLTPQIWHTLPSPKTGTQEEQVAAAVTAMTPLAKTTARMGCQFGLYNHGGWGGEPENLVAVCKALHARGHQHVGIVYNFHHGHGHIEDFAQVLARMKPHLLCLNLNGMADPPTVKGHQNKIIPIGSGVHGKAMIATILKSGYAGPIGILGHKAEEDVAVSLRNNLEGLARILAELTEQ